MIAVTAILGLFCAYFYYLQIPSCNVLIFRTLAPIHSYKLCDPEIYNFAVILENTFFITYRSKTWVLNAARHCFMPLTYKIYLGIDTGRALIEF